MNPYDAAEAADDARQRAADAAQRERAVLRPRRRPTQARVPTSTLAAMFAAISAATVVVALIAIIKHFWQ